MKHVVLGLSLLSIACGASAPPETAPSPDAPVTVRSPPPEPIGLARADGDAQLVEDLRVFCADMGTVLGDRSRALRLRIRAVERELRERDRARYRRIDDFLDPASEGPRERFYEAIVEAAAARGVRFECPDAQRVLALFAAGDDDIDGEPIASGAEELARLCQVVRDFPHEGHPPDVRAMRVAHAIDATVRHPELRMALDAIANAVADQRYMLLQSAARELGAPGWQCPELETLWAPSP